MTFHKQVVVITGGAKGIGRALVEAYCKENASVVFIDKDYVKGSELEFQLRAAKRTCFLHTDISNPKKAQEAIALIYKMFHHINILINNAGYINQKSIYETTIQDFTDVIQTNLVGTFATSQMFALLRRNHSHDQMLGRIINLSSTRAFMSEPNTESYAASKGSISAMTHNLAITLSNINVQVNAIAPGWICNDNYEALSKADHLQHPSNRVGTSIDIVKACFYLSDPENDFVNGQTLVIDGGMTKKMIYTE